MVWGLLQQSSRKSQACPCTLVVWTDTIYASFVSRCGTGVWLHSLLVSGCGCIPSWGEWASQLLSLYLLRKHICCFPELSACNFSEITNVRFPHFSHCNSSWVNDCTLFRREGFVSESSPPPCGPRAPMRLFAIDFWQFAKLCVLGRPFPVWIGVALV